MHKTSVRLSIFLCTVILGLTVSGCDLVYVKERPTNIQKINQLKEEVSELERARTELERRLKGEIADKDVKVEMLERGLVITFVAEVLFDSGKADLRKDALPKIDKVSRVLKTTVRDLNVGIEGHTDNVPIKYSGWKSNWELSSARAISVLHHLVNKNRVDPKRLAATGYGEYHPVANNRTKEGRQANRRVEIVILPKMSKQAPGN